MIKNQTNNINLYSLQQIPKTKPNNHIQSTQTHQQLHYLLPPTYPKGHKHLNKNKDQIAYSKIEETINIWTHLGGAMLSLIGVVFLFHKGVGNTSTLGFISIVVYGFCLVLMFMMSGLYHARPLGTTSRVVFRRLDHCSIALLIAGTYAPFMVIGLGSTLGYVIAAIEIALCTLIISLNATNVHKFRIISLIAYVVMGWMCIIAFVPLYRNVGIYPVITMLIAGLFYTGGIVFYKSKKIPLNHAIWHFFVLAGAILMFVAVWMIL